MCPKKRGIVSPGMGDGQTRDPAHGRAMPPSPSSAPAGAGPWLSRVVKEEISDVRKI